MTQEQKEQTKTRVGELLVDEINRFLDESRSPVSGGGFKSTRADGRPSKLFEDGDLRSQITFQEHPSGVKVGIFDSAPDVEKLKSFNHNKGDTLPQRQFIPLPKQEFKEEIQTKIDSIVKEVSSPEKTTVADVLSVLDGFTLEFPNGES